VVERAEKTFVSKPWGRVDLRPWADDADASGAIGEIWFERQDGAAPRSLLLKLLFTSQPLSIQVHPDNALAHTLGLSNGKTEAWYILDASANSKCGVGLRRAIGEHDLRFAIHDGSIQDLVNWMSVQPDDFIFVPAGTIHAIGEGVVLAEVQQRSDTTFRLFDYGRGRDLHADLSVAASDREASNPAEKLRHAIVSDGAQHLLSCPYFTLELLDLPANARAHLHSSHETWVLVLKGGASFQQIDAEAGDALFLDREIASVAAGTHGLKALAAYDSAHRLIDFFDAALSPGVQPSTSGFAAPIGAAGGSMGAWIITPERNA
jgi:mannose-6-phosphate isomerase